jgi:hypothetical protein
MDPFFWGGGSGRYGGGKDVPTGDSLKLEFIFVIVLGLGNKTRLTLCKIVGSYSFFSKDSCVKVYDTMYVIRRVVCVVIQALHSFQMLRTADPVTLRHIPGDLNLQIF